MVETRVAAAVMSKEIVVERHISAAPDATVTMISLVMHRCVKGLGNDAPLDCRIRKIIEGSVFVSCPADRAMVYDKVSAMSCTDSISLDLCSCSQSHAEITHDHMIRSNEDIMVTDCDSLSRSSLSENCEIRVNYIQRGCKVNVSADCKCHDTWSLSLDCMSQSTL